MLTNDRASVGSRFFYATGEPLHGGEPGSLVSRLGLDDLPAQRGAKLNTLFNSLLNMGDMASAVSCSPFVNQHRNKYEPKLACQLESVRFISYLLSKWCRQSWWRVPAGYHEVGCKLTWGKMRVREAENVRPHNSLASRLGLDDPLVSPMRFLGFPPQRGTKLNILLDSLLEQGDMASAASSSHCVNQHRGEPNDRNSLANLFLTVSSCMFCHMVPAVHGGSFRLATMVLVNTFCQLSVSDVS